MLPGLGTLQPSEIAKFAVVLVFAHIISLNHDRMQTFATGVLPFMVILGAVTVLMLLEPHLSGTLLILGIGAVLMFVGGTGLKWFALAGIAGAGAIAAAVVLLPPLRTVFSVVPLNPLEWLTVLALSLLPTGVCEAVKRRAKSRREQGRRLVRHQPRRFAP